MITGRSLLDWSERHHDIALVDDDGALVAKRRIAEGAAGFRQLLELLAEHSERTNAPARRGSATPLPSGA